MRQVDQEHRDFGDIVQARAAAEHDRLEVLEHAAYLRFHVALNHLHGRRVQRNLARDPYRVADAYGLGIGTDGGRGVAAGYDLFRHAAIEPFGPLNRQIPGAYASVRITRCTSGMRRMVLMIRARCLRSRTCSSSVSAEHSLSRSSSMT